MDNNSKDSEVSSSNSVVSTEKEKPESTTSDENGTINLSLDANGDASEPPTKSPKKDTEVEDSSIEMASVVSSTDSTVIGAQNVQSTVDPEGNPLPESSENCKLDKDSPTSDSEEPMSVSEPEPEVEVELRVVYNKQLIPVKMSLKRTVLDLKKSIESTTKVTPELMKVLVKGAKDNLSLESLGISKGSKILVIGTPLDDVLAISKAPTAKELSGEEPSEQSDSQNWCTIPRHRKILDKGVPDDVMAGIKDEHDQLPPYPLTGMLSSKGSKVRLTFKLEADELWIGTKERTEKVPISSIRSVLTQPIVGFEHYHILAIQLGPTEASRFYIYWVPCQYVNAIKNILGS